MEINDKEFWEKFGFRHDSFGSKHDSVPIWIAPNNDFYEELPESTLGNLFKYCVPQVINTDGYSLELIYTISHCEAHIRPHYVGDKHYSSSNKDPALALKQALWEVVR